MTFQTTGGSSFGSAEFMGANPYGNRVDSTEVGSFSYGALHGFTPNVTATWSGVNATPSGCGSGYGSLVNVVWGSGSLAGTNPTEVIPTLEADPGFLVEFRGLDVARWASGSYLGSYVKLTDAGGVTVDLLPNTELTSTLNLDYSATPYVSTKFTLTFGQAWWTAIDNVAFSQDVVPEPATLAALGAGLAILSRRRRR